MSTVGWLAGATAIATDTSGCHRVLFMICNFLENYYSLRSSAIHDGNTQKPKLHDSFVFFPKYFYLECVCEENGEILKIVLMLVLSLDANLISTFRSNRSKSIV